MKATAENPYPKTFEEFLDWFPCDADCERYLEWVRWPDGFECPAAAARRSGVRSVDCCNAVRVSIRPRLLWGRSLKGHASRCFSGFMLCG